MTPSEIIEQLQREIEFITSNPEMANDLRVEHGQIASGLLRDLELLISTGG